MKPPSANDDDDWNSFTPRVHNSGFYLQYDFPPQQTYYNEHSMTPEQVSDYFLKNNPLIFGYDDIYTQDANGKYVIDMGAPVVNWITKAQVAADTPQPIPLPAGADARKLYAYLFKASVLSADGFTWREKAHGGSDLPPNDDLIWDEVSTAYLTSLVQSARIVWSWNDPKKPENFSRFRSVKWLGEKGIIMYRMIDVKLGSNGDRVIFETDATETNADTSSYPSFSKDKYTYMKPAENGGIPLTQFLTQHVVHNCPDIETRTFRIYSVDGTFKDYSYAEITGGKAFFFFGEEKICLMEDESASKTVEYPVRIHILGSAWQADDTFPVPALCALP
jgi:hypothetical protein